MQFRTFCVPADSDKNGIEDVNDFLRQSSIRVLSVEKVFSEKTESWCICVEYQERFDNKNNFKCKKDKETKPDPKDNLNEIECARYDVIAEIRDKVREETGANAYDIFYNSEVVNLAKIGEISAKSLMKAKVNMKHISNHGARVVELWEKYKHKVDEKMNEKSEQPVSGNSDNGQPVTSVLQVKT